MNRNTRFTFVAMTSLVAILELGLVEFRRSSFAQEERIFGEGEGEGETAAPAPLPAVTAVDPTVAAILATNPTTPEELLRAAILVVDLGEPAAAKPLIAQLTTTTLDDKTLLDLVKRFGSAPLFRFATIPELQPEGSKFAEQALGGSSRYSKDAARLKELIAKLADPNEDTRATTISDLRGARDEGARALILALGDEKEAVHREGIRQALVAMGEDAFPVVSAALRSSDSHVSTPAARVIGSWGRTIDLPDLLFAAHSERAAETTREAARRALKNLVGGFGDVIAATTSLRKRAIELASPSPLDQALEDELDPAATAPVWTWDESARQPVTEILPLRTARLALAARYAADARELSPQDAEWAIREMTLRLEAKAARTPLPGADFPSDAEVSEGGLEFWSETLRQSSANGQIGAAIGAVRSLARLGNLEAVVTSGPTRTPLVEALQSPNRSLRFEALAAVIRLEPNEPFAGSSLVRESLGFFAAANGSRRAAAAHLGADRGATLIGLLAGMGMEGEGFRNRRDLIRDAISTPDVELILIDYRLASLTSGWVIQQLRRDIRTAQTPIAILSSAADRFSAEELAKKFSGAAVMIEPQDPAGMEFQAKRVLARHGRSLEPLEIRLARANQALTWLWELSEKDESNASRQALYELSRLEETAITAMRSPGRATRAIPVLGRWGTHPCQRALVDFASQTVQPLELRQAALAAFIENLSYHGTLLSQVEIDHQYRLYNGSEGESQETQKILSTILDGLETAAGEREPRGAEGSASRGRGRLK